MNKRLIAAIIILCFLTGVALLVGTRTAAPDTRMQVSATYYPLYFFAKEIGGNKIVANNITPAGSEPHDYEPTPQQLVTAQKSGVFIYNGSGMEPWVPAFLKEYKKTPVKSSAALDLRAGDGGADPHFWLDPVLAQKIVANIRDGLGAADPVNAMYYTQQAAVLSAKLAQLDADIAGGLRVCAQRTVVTSHDAFGYYAARYNLSIVPIAGISPDQEPDGAKLAQISDLVRREHITYIFFESLVSPKLAQTLATETGTKTAVFDPIEGLSNEDQQSGKDYFSVQRENLANLRRALACQ